jgi:hypothetical protein
MLDALLAAEELPEEYRDRCQVHLPLQLISPVLCILVKVIITQHLFLVKQENISIIVYRAISFNLLLLIQKTKRRGREKETLHCNINEIALDLYGFPELCVHTYPHKFEISLLFPLPDLSYSEPRNIGLIAGQTHM